MHRRKTMVVQQSVELVLQLFNVVLYLLPNVWSLVQRCDWDGNLVSAQAWPTEDSITDPRTCRTQTCKRVPSLPLQISACAIVRWSLWFTVRACCPLSCVPLTL